MTVLGVGSYAYWGRSISFKAGDPSSDTQQAFNPLLSFDCPEVKYIQEKLAICNSLDPSIIYDTELQEGTITVSAILRDPFMAGAMFTYNTMPTIWTGLGDTITMDFTKVTNKTKNIWVQVHIHDDAGSSHINLLFDGGEIESYRWIIEQGKPIIEEYVLKFCEISINEEAPNIDTGFDDGSFDGVGLNGGWSLWDGAYTKDTAALAVDATITWNNAAIPGMAVQRCIIDFGTPKERYWVLSSLIADNSFSNVRASPIVTLEGVIKGGQALAEYVAAYSSKNKYIFKVVYGTTKFFQITNMYHEGFAGLQIPPAGQKVNGRYMFSGGIAAASLSWTGVETTDPEDMINHTNI
jgi:hypothetical protein